MYLRLPTLSQVSHEVNAMSQQFSNIEKLQSQISTGKKLQYASDDPLLAGRIKSISNFVEQLKSYELNGQLAQSRALTMMANIAQGTAILEQVQELLLQAQNDTLNNTDRSHIAANLNGYLTDLVNLANMQDSDGEYIFSGINTHTMPYSKTGNTYIYQGASETTHIALNAGNNVAYNESGLSVFGNIKTGNGVYTLSSDIHNNTGSGVILTAGLGISSAFVADTYTINMVTNGVGDLAYTVSGALSGQLIPAPPLLSPADAPPFLADNTLVFNGVSVQITGAPNAGDIFTVSPSGVNNIFNTVESMIDSLNTPVSNEKEKADFHQVFSGLAASFTSISARFNQYTAEIGSRSVQIDDQININTSALLDQQMLMGKLSDADMADVISRLTQQLSALEITQQSYLTIQKTFSSLLQLS